MFLLDVDNTLLDNDRVTADLMRYLEREVGAERQQRYWAIFEELRTELGYADYLGALQRYRDRAPARPASCSRLSSFLVNYPFANRLFPDSLDVIEHLAQWGPTVDPLGRRRRLSAAQGRALGPFRGGRAARPHLHPQGARARRRRAPLPGRSLRAGRRQAPHPDGGQEGLGCSASRPSFPRQGHYAHDPKVATYPRPDITIERIGDVIGYDLAGLLEAARVPF